VAAFGEAFGPDAEFSAVDNYGMTLARVIVASVCCLTVGVTAGIIMGTSERADDYLFVYVLGTFAFPSVIWAFLAVIWFGLTTWFVAVFTVFMIVTPYVAISIKEGIEELDRTLPEMAEAFEASTFLVWQNIYICQRAAGRRKRCRAAGVQQSRPVHPRGRRTRAVRPLYYTDQLDFRAG